MSGAGDMLATESSVMFAYDRVGSTDKKHRRFSKANGDSADYGHGDLILGYHATEEVFPPIVEWLDSHNQGA